jgi:hypothetical protein
MALLTSSLRPIPTALLREMRSLTLHGPRAKEGLKPVLSVLLAVSVATILNLDDLFWAAFSGYMVMRGSIAETIPRGVMSRALAAGRCSACSLLPTSQITLRY